MTREEELDWLCRLRSEIYVYMPKEWLIPMNNALDMAIKALEQEPSGGVISREYLFKVLDDFCGHDRTATITLDTLADLVYDMPSVKQEPKTGHWIKQNDDYFDWYECSECGYGAEGEITSESGVRFRYCPICGARLESEG